MGNPLKYIRILLIFLSVACFPPNTGSIVVNEAEKEPKLSSEEPNSPVVPSSVNVPVNCNLTDLSLTSAPIAAPTSSHDSNEPEEGMIQATLPFVMKHLGMIECEGADNASNFLKRILGEDVNFNRSDYLCGPTCRGKCISRPKGVGIPPSIYPFGCSCEQHGCDINGPIIAPLIKPTFRIVCRQDPRCTCVGMGPGQFTGYSCNWVNTKSGLPVTFKEVSVTPALVLPGSKGRPPINLAQSSPQNKPFTVQNFFPIKWCSCCPRFPIVRSGEGYGEDFK